MILSRVACFVFFCAGVVPRPALAATKVDLDGPGWTFRTTLGATPEPVSVPHCWLVHPGYEKYLGHAFYERDFEVPAVQPGQVVRLHFDAVYDVARVWLNGRRLGTHDGGYTAFEFDITKQLRPGKNDLLVDVDNTPTFTSIPALATGSPSADRTSVGAEARATIVGWLPYGGIVRPVTILISGPVYLRGLKIEAKPDLKSGDAVVSVRATLHNGSDTSRTAQAAGTVAEMPARFPTVHVAAHADAEVTWTTVLHGAHLWSVRDPFLYHAEVRVPEDAIQSRFGVREVRVQGTQLLLNGRPVHLYGANRVSEDPEDGLLESDAIVQRDMSDMLADNMRMMRIAHYPQAQSLLDFADEHGMLIIPEAGNWNMSAWQMADPGIRSLWKQQMTEMMQQDWNHPSVIAWSVGNEYESYTREGIAWTHDMRDFTLGLDKTRLITFASRYTGDPAVKTGPDEASQYSDFVSINVYGNYAMRFDRAHELYPDKPIFVTEFGRMGEPGVHDPLRIADITEAVDAMKARPYMIGGSLWTWADYRSFFRGTPEDGIRKWGVVTFERQHRDSWKVVQKLFDTPLP
ncbi:beta-glucuronidase [Bryocella elongata]|uniref:Beta-glucuronidase n=1 Tax=Bryocella elongata TaxID=863522 RepID=A0A1H5TDE1_9BACT|nr:glycoside hydrolase family 2 TIM barrel-domain containing protein [Bryocella elongata]SEF60101.1 beta-glucuronidase [Bryocella elongata]